MSRKMPQVCQVNWINKSVITMPVLLLMQVPGGRQGALIGLLVFCTAFQLCALLALGIYTWMRLKQFRSQLNQKEKLIEELRVELTPLASDLDESESDSPWLSKVEQVVKSNLGDLHFGVDRLAELMEMGRTSFYRRIRSATGMSANEYIRELRLQTAKELLESGRTTDLKTLCEQVGMRSGHYFSKLYEERFGKPPGEFF